jgi:hypothetical protein
MWLERMGTSITLEEESSHSEVELKALGKLDYCLQEWHRV